MCFSSKVNDVVCFIALSGIVLMIVENEITFRSFDYHETYITSLIKLIITISTIILVSLIIYYHYQNAKLYCVNNSIQNWYVALTRAKIIQILVEVLICSIHPFPRGFFVYRDLRSEMNNLNSTASLSVPVALSFVPMDVALGLPSKYTTSV
jgi:hypothetical protein